MSGDFWFDALLGLVLITLALATVRARQLAAAVMIFVVFGLLLALAWARLGAADLALAEAAIGAGLTGALLFSALARQGRAEVEPAQLNTTASHSHWYILVLSVLLTGIVLTSLWWMPQQPEHHLMPLALEYLDSSGTEHPVTAVLLNFRAWDTLLELIVLLLALLGTRLVASPMQHTRHRWPLARQWSRRLAPLLILVAFFVLWRGATAPGGAFQAGALLAAAAVVLRLNHQLPPLHWRYAWVRLIVLSGILAFVLAGALSAVLQYQPALLIYWLEWPLWLAKPLILFIELCATLAIGLTLTLLVVGEPEELTS